MKPTTKKSDNFNLSSTRIVSLLALLSALSIVGRIYFSVIPNVQPSTFILIAASMVFGIRFGLLLALLSTIGSNIILGLGWWTVFQLIGWSAVAGLSGLIGRRYKLVNHYLLTLFSGAMGYLYGIIQSIPMFFMLGPKGFLGYYMAGLLFDTYHAAGNMAFYFLLAPVVFKMFERYLDGCRQLPAEICKNK